MQAAGNFTYKIMPLNEAPELSLWFEVKVLLQYQDIWYFLLWLVRAAVKCIADVMGSSIRGFQQQQDFISSGAIDAVAGCDPDCILHAFNLEDETAYIYATVMQSHSNG